MHGRSISSSRHILWCAIAVNASKGPRKPLWLGAKEISFSATNFAPTDLCP
jgi:hypothetical protein